MNKKVKIEFDIELYAWDNSGTVEALEKALVTVISKQIPNTLPGHVSNMAVEILEGTPTKILYSEEEVKAHYEYPENS